MISFGNASRENGMVELAFGPRLFDGVYVVNELLQSPRDCKAEMTMVEL